MKLGPDLLPVNLPRGECERVLFDSYIQ